jgi:hypothetical protein
MDVNLSHAKLHLLHLFQTPRSTDSITALGWRELWAQALGEDPATTIRNMQASALLVPASTIQKLGQVLGVAALKGELRKRNLRVSGKKADLLNRLFEADHGGCEAITAGLDIWVCSPTGDNLASKYVADREMRLGLAVAKAISALEHSRLNEAVTAIHDFNRTEVLTPGLGFTPDTLAQIHLSMLRHLFENGPPAILGNIKQEHRQTLLIAAGLDILGLERASKIYLPRTLDIGSRLDIENSIRMCVFAASHFRRVEQFREAHIGRARIGGAGDHACEHCKAIQGLTLPIEDLPLLPFGKCTCETGCRCIALAVIED